ncbi:helix-turn-helix transcriptional regulator [Methylobacterium komagatae]
MTALQSLPAELARRRLLGTRDAAAFIGVSVKTFRRMKERGQLPQPLKPAERKFGWMIGDLSDFVDCRTAGLSWHEFKAAQAGNDNRR